MRNWGATDDIARITAVESPPAAGVGQAAQFSENQNVALRNDLGAWIDVSDDNHVALETVGLLRRGRFPAPRRPARWAVLRRSRLSRASSGSPFPALDSGGEIASGSDGAGVELRSCSAPFTLLDIALCKSMRLSIRLRSSSRTSGSHQKCLISSPDSESITLRISSC